MNCQNNILQLIEAKKIREAKVLIHTSVNSKSLYYYLYGLCCCSEEKFKTAVFFFKLAVINGLNHYLLYYNLGVAYLELGNYHQALKNFQKSAALNKVFYKNYINIAYIYIKNNDIKSAYRFIETGLANNDCSELKSIENKLLPFMIYRG